MYISVSASGMTRRDEEAISGDPVIKAQILTMLCMYIYTLQPKDLYLAKSMSKEAR